MEAVEQEEDFETYQKRMALQDQGEVAEGG